MKSRTSIFLLLAALLGVLLILRLWHGEEPISSHYPALAAALPAKTDRASAPFTVDGIPKITQATQKLADELEAFAIEWRRINPEGTPRAWEEAAFQRLSRLATSQILALTEMPPPKQYWLPGDGDSTRFEANFMSFFSEHLLRALGFKDYLAARSLVDRMRTEQATDDNSFGVLFYPDRVEFGLIRSGQAMRDPAGAWTTFLDDHAAGTASADEAVGLLRVYASRNPEVALQAILNVPDKEMLKTLLGGYLEGVPEGRDWEQMAGELAENIRQTPAEADIALYRRIAAAWAEWQPHEALAWYSAQSAAHPPETPDAEEGPPGETMQVLSYIPDDRLPAVVERMVHGNSSELAAELIQGEFTGRFYPSDLPLLDSILLLPSAETRASLLEHVSENLVPLGLYTSKQQWRREETNQGIAELKRVTAMSALPPELRQGVESSIQAIEESQRKFWSK